MKSDDGSKKDRVSLGSTCSNLTDTQRPLTRSDENPFSRSYTFGNSDDGFINLKSEKPKKGKPGPNFNISLC